MLQICKFRDIMIKKLDEKLDGHSLSLLNLKDMCSLHQIIRRVVLEIFGLTKSVEVTLNELRRPKGKR